MTDRVRPDGVSIARHLVAQRFTQARAAWLGGSVPAGTATATSDLDITVLLDGPPAQNSSSSLSATSSDVTKQSSNTEVIQRQCQHLAKLRLAGLVKGRREGTFVYYSAADQHVQGLLNQALFHVDHFDRSDAQDDVASARLAKG